MDDGVIVLCGIASVLVSFIAAGCFICIGHSNRSKVTMTRENMRNYLFRSNQQDDIFNISSRVPQGQGQWPTHEGHLSLDHITITNELTNKSYNDEPPSYDEAMRLALSASTSPSSQEAPPPLETPKTTTAN